MDRRQEQQERQALGPPGQGKLGQGRLAPGALKLLAGIGDDCAVFSASRSHESPCISVQSAACSVRVLVFVCTTMLNPNSSRSKSRICSSSPARSRVAIASLRIML